MNDKPYRPYKISGYAVSQQELLDQAGMIVGREIKTVREAKRIIIADGRDVEDCGIGTPFSELTPGRFAEIGRSWGYD